MKMRSIGMAMFLGISLGLLSACAAPPAHTQIAAASAQASCDTFEGYPDCHDGHLVKP
jgi:hypothetical protein